MGAQFDTMSILQKQRIARLKVKAQKLEVELRTARDALFIETARLDWLLEAVNEDGGWNPDRESIDEQLARERNG